MGFFVVPRRLTPSPLFPHGHVGEQQNPVVGLHRPHGWLQRRRPLSAEKGATSAAVSSPGTVFPPGTSEATLARVSRRRRRQRYLQTRLHGTDGASSAFSSPPSSTPLPSTTSSTTTRPPTSSTSPNSGAFSGAGGAEWAGWECRFSGTNGKPVPVPEDYVPESLREWDVEVQTPHVLLFDPKNHCHQVRRKGVNCSFFALPS